MKTESLPVVDCAADPRGRGRAHGEALRGVIRDKVGRWHDAIGEAYQEPAPDFLARFLGATSFRAAIATHTPDLLEEVKGIAEGAGLAEDTAYALQLMDEEWWFGSAGLAHCSGVAAAPGDSAPTVLGQTMDLPAWHDGAQAVLRLADEGGGDSLVFTSAGMIGLMGLSSRGFGVCVNTLAALRPNPAGLPVAFVVRGLLAKDTMAAAGEFLCSVPHASGQNYLLGDAKGVCAFECSAAGAEALPARGGRILHTNHPLASPDLLEGAGKRGNLEDSVARLRHLETWSEASASVSAQGIRHALSSSREEGGVSVEAGDTPALLQPMTVGAVVYEIAERLSFSVAAGPPSRESWRAMFL